MYHVQYHVQKKCLQKGPALLLDDADDSPPERVLVHGDPQVPGQRAERQVAHSALERLRKHACGMVTRDMICIQFALLLCEKNAWERASWRWGPKSVSLGGEGWGRWSPSWQHVGVSVRERVGCRVPRRPRLSNSKPVKRGVQDVGLVRLRHAWQAFACRTVVPVSAGSTACRSVPGGSSPSVTKSSASLRGRGTSNSDYYNQYNRTRKVLYCHEVLHQPDVGRTRKGHEQDEPRR